MAGRGSVAGRGTGAGRGSVAGRGAAACDCGFTRATFVVSECLAATTPGPEKLAGRAVAAIGGLPRLVLARSSGLLRAACTCCCCAGVTAT